MATMAIIPAVWALKWLKKKVKWEVGVMRDFRDHACDLQSNPGADEHPGPVSRHTNQQLMTLALAADQAARRAMERGDIPESEAHSREVARLLGMMK